MSDEPTINGTRENLIAAGLHLFGTKGYEGTSTRELAKRAGTNIASITYHFGGKAGLRTACAAEVAARVSRVLDATGTPELPADSKGAAMQIERMIAAFVKLIVGTPEARDMVAFMLRELTGHSDTADTVYAAFVEPRHRMLCALWAMATGRDPEDEAVKLAVFALIGQVVYFRIAATFVLRRMSWDALGADETEQISATIIESLRDALERHRT
jgi:AcrR family transcriptional regulator